MTRWIVGSMLHGGSIELFLVPASDPRLVQRPLYVLSCLSEIVAHVAAAGFLSLSHYLNGPLPYALRHITLNKMC